MCSYYYQEHGLNYGDEVIRLSWVDPVNGRSRTQLYRYDTGADWMAHHIQSYGGVVKRDWVIWNGIDEVDMYNGD